MTRLNQRVGAPERWPPASRSRLGTSDRRATTLAEAEVTAARKVQVQRTERKKDFHSGNIRAAVGRFGPFKILDVDSLRPAIAMPDAAHDISSSSACSIGVMRFKLESFQSYLEYLQQVGFTKWRPQRRKP
jgi:hypothetical protein